MILLSVINIFAVIVILWLIANILDYLFAIDKMNSCINKYINRDAGFWIVVTEMIHLVAQLVSLAFEQERAIEAWQVLGYTFGGIGLVAFILFVGGSAVANFCEQFRQNMINRRKIR